jgi:hypothetical protein
VTTTDTPADILRDPRTEAWLDERRVQWTFDPAFDLAGIDVAASLANQARLEALDSDVVDRYAADMERGDQFPPLLLQTRKRRRPMVLGGNHRRAAAAAHGVSVMPAYVVECEPEMALRLMYEDNRRHGLPPSETERIAQAIHLVGQGYTLAAAAEVVGVPEGKVARARYVVVADQRAKDLGLPIATFCKLPKTTRARLASIRSDPVFEAASRLVLDAALGTEEVYDLATRLNDCRSDTAGLKLVAGLADEHRERIQATAGGKSSRHTPRSALSSAVTVIDEVNPEDVARSCATDDQRLVLARRCAAAKERLELVIKALHRAGKQ